MQDIVLFLENQNKSKMILDHKMKRSENDLTNYSKCQNARQETTEIKKKKWKPFMSMTYQERKQYQDDESIKDQFKQVKFYFLFFLGI